ncbi:hypothetical protein QFC21_001153 [Naganishia friedmannii]|uniref:Uncharacterized protein n=1 Tax=Naganishia friedmannii TaxID=89922 RepID=A0ACC2W7J6_9TREE|nr:hypothetical protein QFC21_001153 [Naganishia friedmannii]
MFLSTLHRSSTIPSLRPLNSLYRLLGKAYSTASVRAPTPAIVQLSRLRDLIHLAGSTNKPTEKQQILAEFPDLKELLDHIYDRHIKHHITSTKLNKILDQGCDGAKSSSILDAEQTTLQDLLNTLSSRKVSGNAAVEAVQAFLHANNVLAADNEPGQPGADELSLREVFMRVLDKNLKAGIADKTLKAVQWDRSSSPVGDPEKDVPASTRQNNEAQPGHSSTREHLASQPPIGNDEPTQEHKEGLPVLQPPTRLGGFSCALGKTVLRKGLEKVLQVPQRASASNSPVSSGLPRWLASRKLDGVRLLVVMDVFLPHTSSEDQAVKVLDLWTLSRSGKEYHTLDTLKNELAQALSGSDYIKTLLADEPRYAPPAELAGHGHNQRLVLDGELCHLIYDSGVPAGKEDAVKEDFAEVVSMVRRKDYTIQQPAMFLLDVLPWSVFLAEMNKDNGGAASSYKVFAERVKDCQALVEQVAVAVRETGVQPVLRRLQQTEVTSIEQVEGLIEEAAEKGWEGLILRRGDLPYEGKRSSHILKYKEWQDGEYIAEGIDVNTMRLPVNGVFAEREAMANVWITHKVFGAQIGTRVSVGSGFTADQRLRYAQDPTAIIGKEITVEYFAESTNSNRRGVEGGLSLRFPRVKQVWEDGKREV